MCHPEIGVVGTGPDPVDPLVEFPVPVPEVEAVPLIII